MASRQWDPDDNSGTFSDAFSLESRSRNHRAAMDRINALMENTQIVDDPWDLLRASTMSPLSGYRFIEANPGNHAHRTRGSYSQPRIPSPAFFLGTPEARRRYAQRNRIFGRPQTYSSHYDWSSWLRQHPAREESGRIARTRASRRHRRVRTPRAPALTRAERLDFALSRIRDRENELRAELCLLQHERESLSAAYRDSLERDLVDSESDPRSNLGATREEPDWQIVGEGGAEMEEDS